MRRKKIGASCGSEEFINMTSEKQELTHPCIECQAGVMHRDHRTYFTWLGDELITVQNFPAWVCDVCGRREYDVQATQWLNLILSPNAGKPTAISYPQEANSVSRNHRQPHE